ncbi:hypothetical protein LOZ53_002164 [Ophidiomyces ophidiicola]|nr:hypothetical protein LOZ55_003200 [Ophidiomyces ophidiicola]KAI1980563.1 hypothetical protein LOZ54_005816 [Ophidiomyces ophidiicola]KAI1993255.1 hypothetical protein LOZ53_002164 [Ophidiomyces ophidiicola]KAI1993684.1 hypothetical protein LOZ51_004063 [Ophidiomyces ophidiicola]
MADDDADDYMAMAFSEPAARESLTQRRRRQLREAEARARVPSKAERAAAAAAARDAALATSALDPASKGFQIMARLGYTAGSALGRAPPSTDDDHCARRITEPLAIAVKDGRGGVGLDSLRKRRLRDQLDAHAKRLQTDQLDFRARARLESDARRAEAQFRAAQAVAEGLDLDADEAPASAEHKHCHAGTDTGTDTAKHRCSHCPPVRPLARINLLYRGLVRARELQHRDAHAAHRRHHALADSARDLASPSASRAMAGLSLPACAEDDDLDPDDKLALGRTADGHIVAPDEDDDEDDPELDEFNALPPQDRLARLVRYLRDTHCYCFWCKCRYDSPRMDGCPGLTEDDHD